MTSAYVILIYVVACYSKSSWKRKRIKSSDFGCQNCQLVKMINITGGARNTSQRGYRHFNIIITAKTKCISPMYIQQGYFYT